MTLAPVALLLLAACVPEAEKPDDADGDGWSELDGDCDDGDGAIHPGAAERCDGADQDCDGAVDEDPVDPVTVWDDGDGDGHGAGESRTGCGLEGAASGGDCDDADAEVYPGAAEVCGNARDDDCDGGAGACLPSGSQPLQGVVITGPGAASFGGAVAVIGDQTGDGLADLVVGSWGRDAPSDPKDTPYVWVWSVARDARLDEAQAAVEVLGFDKPGQRAGAALAAADWTGDGVDDLLIGAPGGGGTGPDWGAVYLLEGPLEASETVPPYVSDIGYFAFDGCGLYETGAGRDEFGSGLAAVPDLDGDGVSELAVGAPAWVKGSHSGRVSVFPGGAIDAVSGEPLFHVRSSVPATELGWVIAGLPDWDGAGYGRLLLGSPWSESYSGLLGLVEGHPGEDLVLEELPVRVVGAESGGRFGMALAWEPEAGRVVVGAPSDHTIGPGAVWSLRPDDLVAGTWSAEEVGEERPSPPGALGYGSAVAVGDVDGDALADLLAGAVYGGTAHVSTTLGGEWSHAGTSWSLGLAVALMDGDGDPFADLVLPDPGADVVYVVRGTGW